ncbi:unnamed protein product [Mytilus edulis]|uniref:Uncharacterized protein n=1 Tax=Mytilus edulis TaxID=6550 RepID=A0A8S3PTN0_MYTED|nr:unnamed protein product [Mytilus edulis]
MPSRGIITYALLDTQSDTTFILDDTSASLPLPCEPIRLSLSTITSQQTVIESPAALMFTAGYLMKELVIYLEEGVNGYLCACPCAEGVEVQHIYHDKGVNFYPLSHKELWRADGPSTRSRIIDNYQTLEEDNKGCLPGMEPDLVNYNSLPHGKPLSDGALQNASSSVFTTYAENSSKLSSLGSTQANESFNRIVASKAHKQQHYSVSGSLKYGIAASVAQKNEGNK